MEDTLRRFSGKTVTRIDAEALAKAHFDRVTISLGSFIGLDESNVLSMPYSLRAFSDAINSCMICFEAVGPKYSISICGHTFCKDCSKMHFSSEWLLLKPKDCAACRVPLLSGDVFFIDEDSKLVPTISSKQLSIDNFFKSMRTLTNVSTWPNVEDKFTKHIVITDISSCQPIDLLKTYGERSNNVSVHIFHDQAQSAEVHKFAESF